MTSRRRSNPPKRIAVTTNATGARKRAPSSSSKLTENSMTISNRKTTAKVASSLPLANDDDDKSDASSSSSISTVHEAGACCLCHCSLDYSDLAAFDAAAREEDYSDDDDEDDSSEYVFRKSDPFLPKDRLYQPHNALVYCDTCHRWFHQVCHFVPILVIPSAAFTCLLCQYEEKVQETPKPSKKKAATQKRTSNPVPMTTTSLTSSYPLRSMFQSPPVPGMTQHESAWECDPVVIALKVAAWQEQLHHRLERKIHAALQKYRRSQRTLETLLVQSSKRTRQLHLGTASSSRRRLSQELVQCLVAYTSAKVTLRHTMWGVEGVRQLAWQRAAWSALLQWISHYNTPDDFVTRILFPFGTQHPRRWHPVTPEYTDPPLPRDAVPDEVHISLSTSDSDAMVRRGTRTRRTTVPTKVSAKTKRKTSKPPPAAVVNVAKNDDDSGISLDQLQCCICLSGECTDENDLLLCDGAHCHRAYHMMCLPGSLDATQYEALDDWFCPLCQTQAECLYQIQRHVQRVRHDDDDAWERRRWSQTNHDDDADSLKSWDQVQDVFPEAEEEYDLAQKLRRSRGVCDAVEDKDIHRLLAPILGPDILGVEHSESQVEKNDSDDEDDDNFDPQQRLEDDDDNSSTGSPASLADLSSVELEVPAEEVVALFKEHLLLSPPQDGRRRVSLRLSRRDSNTSYDPGQMDLANILNGKRPRRRIDYRQLNDALFGQLSERELQEWDA